MMTKYGSIKIFIPINLEKLISTINPHIHIGGRQGGRERERERVNSINPLKMGSFNYMINHHYMLQLDIISIEFPEK